MPDRESIPPETYLRASKAGTVIGILLLVWVVAFSFSESSLSPKAYWTVSIGVGLLLVSVPCWLVGQRAKRECLEKQDPSA